MKEVTINRYGDADFTSLQSFLNWIETQEVLEDDIQIVITEKDTYTEPLGFTNGVRNDN